MTGLKIFGEEMPFRFADAHMRVLNKKQTFIRSSYNRDRILFAREYMMQHMDMPPSIPSWQKLPASMNSNWKKDTSKCSVIPFLVISQNHALKNQERLCSRVKKQLPKLPSNWDTHPFNTSVPHSKNDMVFPRDWPLNHHRHNISRKRVIFCE